MSEKRKELIDNRRSKEILESIKDKVGSYMIEEARMMANGDLEIIMSYVFDDISESTDTVKDIENRGNIVIVYKCVSVVGDF